MASRLDSSIMVDFHMCPLMDDINQAIICKTVPIKAVVGEFKVAEPVIDSSIFFGNSL